MADKQPAPEASSDHGSERTAVRLEPGSAEEQQPEEQPEVRSPRPSAPGACAQPQALASPSADRPWGWWRGPGSGNVLAGLDAVRGPLLQLHGALGDSSSAALLQALGSRGQLPGGHTSRQAALAADCWQQLACAAAAARSSAPLRADAACSQPPPLAPQHGRQLSQLQPKLPPSPPPLQRHEAQPLLQPQPQSELQPLPQPQLQSESRPQLQLESQPQLQPLVAQPQQPCASSGAAANDAAAAAAAAAMQGGEVPADEPADVAAEPAGAQPTASADARRPPVPKPPKRPWQPKMAPEEPSWNRSAFSAVTARVSAARQGCSHKFPRSLPEHSSATFALLMMVHGAGWPNHVLWEHWQAAHPPGQVAMFTHLKAGVSLGLGMPGRDAIARHRLKTSVASEWGDVSLVLAQLESMAEILKRCPAVTHIGLASGHDIPVQLITPGLLLPGVSLFGSYQFGATEARTLKVAAVDALVDEASMTEAEAQAWGKALIFHHQWMVLSREHATALVAHTREIMVVGRVIHRACCSVRAGMAPDEFVLVTALRAHGYVRSITRVEVKPAMRYPPGCLLNSYPTLVLFPAESSPHPVTWSDMDTKVKCQVEKHTGQQYFKLMSLSDCLEAAAERCALFFRKVEIRATREEELVMLLSSLAAMWAGRRRATSAGGSRPGSAGGAALACGGRRAKRKRAAGGSSGAPVRGSDSSPAVSSADSDTAGDADDAHHVQKPRVAGAAL